MSLLLIKKLRVLFSTVEQVIGFVCGFLQQLPANSGMNLKQAVTISTHLKATTRRVLSSRSE
jgi:hypothetical protein